MFCAHVIYIYVYESVFMFIYIVCIGPWFVGLCVFAFFVCGGRGSVDVFARACLGLCAGGERGMCLRASVCVYCVYVCLCV